MPRDMSDLFDTLTNSEIKVLLELAVETQPPDATDVDAKVAHLERVLSELGSRAEVPADRALSRACAPSATVDELRQLKGLAKRLLTAVQGPEEEEARPYLVAIAAAMALHGENISSQRLETRRKTYHDLAAVFTGHQIGKVFERASRASLKNDR